MRLGMEQSMSASCNEAYLVRAASDECSVQAPGLEALDLDAVRAYRDALEKEEEGHPWLLLPLEEFLQHLNAAAFDAASSTLRLTPEGLLMFGVEHAIVRMFPNYLLDYRRMTASGGIDERIVSNDGLWGGGVFSFWMRVAPSLGGGGEARNSLRSNEATLGRAAQEALANALVHADYRGRRHVTVLQWPDRIEFANPGRSRVRPNVALEGDVCDPRNPALMKMFSLVGVCHEKGMGLPLVRAACVALHSQEPLLAEQRDPDRMFLTLPLIHRVQRSRSGRGDSAAPAVSVPYGQASPSGLRGDDAPSGGTQEGLARSVDAAHGFSEHAAEGVRRAAISPQKQGEDPARVDAAIARAHGADCEAALELFRESRRIRRADVEALLGVGSTKAKSIVAALVADGIIHAEGGGRSTTYRLSKEEAGI